MKTVYWTLKMKMVVAAAVIPLLFGACKKDISSAEESKSLTVSNDALLPLPCHSLSLVSDYTTSRGQQPPFTFTKTLYSDTRVKSIKMLSRATPNHAAFKKQMWETIGTFGYSTNRGVFTGTKELWEYYIAPNGTGAKKSLGKKNVKLTFEFNSRGHVQLVNNEFGVWDWNSLVWRPSNALHIQYGSEIPDEKKPAEALARIYISGGSDEGKDGFVTTYLPNIDQYGNPLKIGAWDGAKISGTEYTYDYAIARGTKNYSFIPSQNLISFEYNLCEVMQWLPQPTHQRKDVTGVFYGADGGGVRQKQYYKNYKFDAKGNQTSVTYADNVLQKTAWFCK